MGSMREDQLTALLATILLATGKGDYTIGTANNMARLIQAKARASWDPSKQDSKEPTE